MGIKLDSAGGPYGVALSDIAELGRADDGDERVLLVEDVATEADLTIHELRKASLPFIWRRVQTEVGLRRALREFQPTLILSDFTLPQFDGLRALDIAHQTAPDTPFIFVSGSIGEERAIDALQKGASDYVLKTNLTRLAPAVRRALRNSPSAGIAVAPPPPPTPGSLWIADEPRTALHPEHGTSALEKKLRTAIERKQFELYYQPRVSVHTRRIEGVEALLRWRDPRSGLLQPAAFLPLLESSGLILELGDWILEQALQDCRNWISLGLPPVRVSVNISPTQLRQPDFAHRVLQVTQPWASGLCGLDLEITEGALLGDTAAEIKKLRLLRTAGVRVSIDDFGSGQSSLARFTDLPIDSLKIDPTFVRRLTIDRGARTLVSTIVSMAHGLSLSVTAEGVETREQLETLRQLGCDHSQGFLHSMPVSSDELSVFLREGKGWLMLPADMGTLQTDWDSALEGHVNAI
jgi:EAL domain-containing protein (putative c-di-GMP-specific phosphodiesterase class I)/CheY-like chemotaxis protein